MSGALKRGFPFALLGLVSAWMAFRTSGTGDFTIDAWPPVHALAHGDVSDYLSTPAMMGQFATLVQSPFAALAGPGELAEYHWASLPCLFAAGLLGIYLAGIARRRGASLPSQGLIACICLVNPLTFEALRLGHPEEILTAALAVAAVASASEGKDRHAAVLLGLAIASKQWAVIAILPVLMALPRRRLGVAFLAAAIFVVLTLPSVLASPGAFVEVHERAASTGSVVTPWSVWYPFAPVVTERYTVGSTELTANVHEAPALVGSISHPLIVLLAVGLPLALALRRREFRLSGADAMALLALLALLRCALDPVDNLYYHVPLLLALFGWDALERGIPVRGLSGAALALLFANWPLSADGLEAFNAAYILVAVTAGAAIAAGLFRSKSGRKPDFLPDEAQISTIERSGRLSIKGV